MLSRGPGSGRQPGANFEVLGLQARRGSHGERVQEYPKHRFVKTPYKIVHLPGQDIKY